MPSRAQVPDALPADNWQFGVALFGWLPSVSGTVGVRRLNFNVDASFGDILEKSDSLFAFMLHAEAQNGPVGLFIEPIYMRLGFTTKTALGNADSRAEIVYGELGAFYRAIEQPVGWSNRPWFLDLLAGARVTSIDVSNKLTVGKGFSRNQAWVDPFFGGRVRVPLSNEWEMSFRGDVGGFGGGSQISLNGVALVGYDFPLFGAPAQAFAGYKALWQDYRNGDFRWNVTLHGPVIGLNIRF